MRVAFLLLSSLSVACGPHRVTLPPPKPDLTQAERLEAYAQMRPVSRRVPATTIIGASAFRETKTSLILSSGYEIDHPADLLPWTTEGSPLRRHVVRYEEEDAAAKIWSTPFWISVGVGLPLAFFGFASLVADDSKPGAAVGLGGLACLGASVVFQLLASGPRGDADEARSFAFDGFDRALQEKLALCEDDGQIRPCEVQKPVPPPPEPARFPWRQPALAEPPPVAPSPSDEVLEPVGESDL
ncbi:MAG: hypothetical protein IPG45_36350 [Deltaproteobacteria bacterium]|nr:hypothetical protein [Deltaproteobacteria bacterium]